jgi:hypothetical protein
LLRDLGLVLRWRMRRAAGTKRVLLVPQSLRWDSRLAMRFVNLKLSVQLRAMLEDWPLQRIHETVQAQRLETLRLQPTSELGDTCVAPGSKEITYGGNF